MAAAGARRSPGPSSGLRGRRRLGFHPAPPPLLLLFLFLLPPRPLLAGATAAASREPDSPCRLKTVTVSTLPALRESDIGWSGARAGAGTGTGTGAGAAAASSGSAGSAGTAAESRLLLFVRNELPGRIAVQDDLDNTELPFFTLEMSGTAGDISLVYWRQQWLENGTLYFHVSMSSAGQLARATAPTLQEPSEIREEQMHILHISVMGGLIALLLLLLVFTVALYAQRRWQKRHRIPQKSASTEATHEIHYIPSVLLGPQARESFRSSRLQAHNSVIGVPIRETPILDDYDYEEDEDLPRRANHVSREDEFGSQGTHTLDSLGRPGEEKGDFEKKGGISFGRTKGTSGSEADDETQLTFYTEQYRSRRRSKGLLKSPVNKTALTLIAVSSCILAMVCGSQMSCPLTVKVTLHVPEHFIADGKKQA
uniref:astrotactin-2-like isoform X2 n=1 Tax=Halichoerus grypus TaxID=9711 RepID=UPI00165A111B|nr:astrotactin-2-like isoform X2 [Halichoerus grypus]